MARIRAFANSGYIFYTYIQEYHYHTLDFGNRYDCSNLKKKIQLSLRI